MQKGLCVKPRRGSAVLFMSLTPSGGEDGKSLHGSCDVIKVLRMSAANECHLLVVICPDALSCVLSKCDVRDPCTLLQGEKWSATKWIRTGKFV